jgi:hypothetical protein
MRKVKLIGITLIVSALLWAANSTTDAPPKREAGISRNHTRAVVVTKMGQPALVANPAKVN